MKADYKKNNPLLKTNYDTRSTVDNHDSIEVQKIKATIKAYDDAIKCVDKMYWDYYRKIQDLDNSSKHLTYYVLNYKIIYERKSQTYMENEYWAILAKERNKGERDAGAMSDSEYKISSFALDFLIPMFNSASDTLPAASLPEAIVKILQILPEP